MGRCRYDLSEECHNKDCVKCMLERIKIEAEENSFKKYNINNEFKCFAIELPILNSIINDYIEELKGEKE